MATGIPKSKINRSTLTHPENQAGGELRLTYEGKRSAASIVADCPRAILRLSKGEKLLDRWVDQLYFADNLSVLGCLLDDPAVRGQISLIYIDPPYSTNSVFESREQKKAYDDLLLGATFVEFLRERLIVLRELLSSDGSIYVHLDENMVFPIKLIMDEVFGPGNFRNFITRKKCNTKNYTRRTFGNVSDYILFYTKSESYVWNRPFVAWTEEGSRKEYTYLEVSTGRRFKKVPVHAPGIRNGETGKSWRGILPPPGKHWQFPPSVLEEMDRRGEIFWSSNGNPRRKIYLDNSFGIPVQDIWLDFKDAHNQNIEITGYPTEKNIEMLEQIINASSNPGDLVLDCFAGSGTTLVAAGNLARRWIGVDNSKHAIETIVTRLQFGSRPMGDYVNKQRPKTKPSLEPELFDNFVRAQVPLDQFKEQSRTFVLFESAMAETGNREAASHVLEESPSTLKMPAKTRAVSYRNKKPIRKP